MTRDDAAPAADDATRRATIATTHADAATAERVAASLRPDNTAEMDTRTDGDRVVTTVARGTTGGLRSTMDDYVVNATVAAQLTTDPGSRSADADGGATADADGAAATDTTADTNNE